MSITFSNPAKPQCTPPEIDVLYVPESKELQKRGFKPVKCGELQPATSKVGHTYCDFFPRNDTFYSVDSLLTIVLKMLECERIWNNGKRQPKSKTEVLILDANSDPETQIRWIRENLPDVTVKFEDKVYSGKITGRELAVAAVTIYTDKQIEIRKFFAWATIARAYFRGKVLDME